MRSLLLGAIFVCMSISLGNAFFWSSDDPENVRAENGTVTLDTSKIGKGEMKRYRYQEGGNTVVFLLLRDNQGVLRAAMDACEVCWHAEKGYGMKKGFLACINCGMEFALNRIGQLRGGCNPYPFSFTHENEQFSVATQELMTGVRFFPGNTL